jgi:predicted ATPase
VPDAAAKAAPAPELLTRLPRALPSLLGRAGDLATLGALVDGHALVTVTGAGGIGKSLLVQHFLDARRRAHAHGVCWVELAGVTDGGALPATVAEALGVRLGGGDPLAALALAVGPLDLLLALDNAEHLRDDVGRLAALLVEAAPALKLVVTSQVRLGVATERVLRLSTLELPPADAGVEQALASGAVALFVDRAQASDARFTLTQSNLASVVSVCRSVDGLPLAIELAAARVLTLGIHGLASSMGEQLQVLTRNRNRAAPARQQTLRATLEWSHGFLDATEQAVFRRLAVVVGSCSLQLAQQVAADAAGEGPIDAWAVLDALDVLVDRSLVAVLPGDDDASPRYRLLEAPKAFALERLAAAGEVESTQLRLAHAVASLFEQAWDAYLSGRLATGLQGSLAPDCDNARAALAVATCPASVRLQVAAVLQRALPRTLMDERLAHADACEALLEAEPSLQLRMVGWLCTAWTWLNTRQVQRCRAAAERAVALARDHERLTGDRRHLYAALGLSAFALAHTGELDSACATLAEMRALEDASWVPRHLMFREDVEFAVAGFRGDHAERARMTRERVARAPDARDKTVHMSNLIDAELAAGDVAAAATGRALVGMLVMGRDDYVLTMARLNLCAALLALGAVTEARPVAQAGWPQALRFKQQWLWADYLALLTALEQRPAAAARLSGYSIAAHAVVEEAREVNEAAAFDRVCRLAASTLGDAEFERLQAEGRTLRDEDVAAIAFGSGGA